MGQTRLTRLLVATDGSDAGEHAVEFAGGLAKAAGAQLEVLGVETAGLPAVAAVGERVYRHESARNVTWVRGVPGVEIVRRAEQWGADLVVMGRRDRMAGVSLSLGLTADAVVRRRAGACLLVPRDVHKLDRMLIALDGTRRGLGILEPAAGMAQAMGTAAVAACVLPETAPQPGAPSPDVSGSLDPRIGRVREALAQFPALGGAGILEVRRGTPVREILALLEAAGADLLVLGVRRGGPPGEMGSGHVGQDLLRAAPVAILTVPI